MATLPPAWPNHLPRRRRRATVVGVLIAGLTLSVLCVGVMAGGYLILTPCGRLPMTAGSLLLRAGASCKPPPIRYSNPAPEPGNATLAFLDAVKAGEPRDAYALLCAQTQQRYSAEEFAQYLSGRPRPLDYTVTNVAFPNQTNGTEGATAEVNANLRYVEGSVKAYTFHLVKEGGSWKVCSQTPEPY